MIASKAGRILILALAASCLLSSCIQAQQSHSEASYEWEFEAPQPEFERDTTPVDEARLDRVMAAYAADESLQRERPEWEPDPVEFEPREPRERNSILKAIADFFRAIGPLLGYLLIGLIALAILAALYMVFGESLTLRGRQKEKQAAPDISVVPDLRPDRAAATTLLEDADALAAEGRFAEAVHLLLFRSIDDIQDKHAGLVARSLTSREIGALSILPAPVRDSLSPIIRIVERSFFGGRTVDETGWKEARASYQSFAFGGAWG